MKFICLGYFDQASWDGLSPAEQASIVDECTAYDAVLHAGGHFTGGEALQEARSATTVRWRDGHPAVTDGPFAETKEQLGGILILEARDMDEAIRLISRHPGIRLGPFEIRPADEAFMRNHPILKSLQGEI